MVGVGEGDGLGVGEGIGVGTVGVNELGAFSNGIKVTVPSEGSLLLS